MDETTVQPLAINSLQARCAFCFDALSQDMAVRHWGMVTGYAVAFCSEDHRKIGVENPRGCRVTGQTRLIGCVVPVSAA